MKSNPERLRLLGLACLALSCNSRLAAGEFRVGTAAVAINPPCGIELGNGSIGHIPHRSAYAEGNCEVVSARCGEGSGELLVQAAVKLLSATTSR